MTNILKIKDWQYLNSIKKQDESDNNRREKIREAIARSSRVYSWSYVRNDGVLAYTQNDWNKTLLEKMFGKFMPRGADKMPLSKMNFGGAGQKMIKNVMKKHNAMPLPDLIELAKEQDVKLVACTMTMDLLGLKQEELHDGIEYAGVAAYLADAEDGNVNLFI